MADHKIIKPDAKVNHPWKRIAGIEVEKFSVNESGKNEISRETKIDIFLKQGFNSIRRFFSQQLIRIVHNSARAINKPVVDIGREYSVSTLNERINTLEEILVRQWSQLKDDDFLAPNDEIKQYVAACHVARQYDRITTQLLSSRLGVTESKAERLLDQLIEDEVVTESYSITYHDVRRTMIDSTIERKLAGLHRINSTETTEPQSKKH